MTDVQASLFATRVALAIAKDSGNGIELVASFLSDQLDDDGDGEPARLTFVNRFGDRFDVEVRRVAT